MTKQQMMEKIGIEQGLFNEEPYRVVCCKCKNEFETYRCNAMRRGSNFGVTYCAWCDAQLALRCLGDVRAMESCPAGSTESISWELQAGQYPAVPDGMEVVP